MIVQSMRPNAFSSQAWKVYSSAFSVVIDLSLPDIGEASDCVNLVGPWAIIGLVDK